MKYFIQFKLLSVTTPSVEDLGNGVKAVLNFIEEEEVAGLKQQTVRKVKSLVAIDEKWINKEIIAEVKVSIISQQYSKPKIYFKALSIKMAQ